MPRASAARKDQGEVFNFGSILGRISNTVADVADQVAPVWLKQQLDLNERVPIEVAPTFQNTDPQRQPPSGLTTTGNASPSVGFNVSQSTLLIGGVVLLGALLFLREV